MANTGNKILDGLPKRAFYGNTILKQIQLYTKKILNNFSNEIKNFKQICPIEMLDKLENPISLKKNIFKFVN